MKSSPASCLFVALIILLSCFILVVPVWAQKDTGSIVGTVKEGTGAVVPNADVEVTDVERGQTFKTTTSDSGEFVASPLHVGRYKVAVAKALFANSGPQNGNNATILGTSQFGSLTAARTPRQIQFALKFSF